MPDLPRFSKMLAIVLLAALALASCRDSADGERFAFDGKLVVFNYRVATATFLVNLKHLRRAGEDEVAFASFEDPAGGAPIVVREKIWPQASKTTIVTPPLKCIVKDRPYKVSIRVLGAEGQELQVLETTIASSQDQSLLPEKPLVVGPLYTPNPEVAGHPGGSLPGQDNCPESKQG